MLQGFKAKLDEPKVTNVQTSTEKTKLGSQEEKEQINKLLREGLYELPQAKQSKPIDSLHDMLHTPFDKLFKAKQNSLKIKLTNKLQYQGGAYAQESWIAALPRSCHRDIEPAHHD